MMLPKPTLLAFAAALLSPSVAGFPLRKGAYDAKGFPCENYANLPVQDMPEECIHQNFCVEDMAVEPVQCSYDSSKKYDHVSSLEGLHPYCVREILCKRKLYTKRSKCAQTPAEKVVPDMNNSSTTKTGEAQASVNGTNTKSEINSNEEAQASVNGTNSKSETDSNEEGSSDEEMSSGDHSGQADSQANEKKSLSVRYSDGKIAPVVFNSPSPETNCPTKESADVSAECAYYTFCNEGKWPHYPGICEDTAETVFDVEEISKDYCKRDNFCTAAKAAAESNTPSDEKTSETNAPSDEKTSEANTPSDEKTSEANTPSDEKTSVTNTPSDEKTSEANTPSDEKTSEANTPSDEKTSDTNAPSEEKTTEANTPSDKKTTEANTPSEEKTTEANTPSDKKTTEANTPSDEKTTEANTPSDKKTSEANTPSEENPSETNTESQDQNNSGQDAQDALRITYPDGTVHQVDLEEKPSAKENCPKEFSRDVTPECLFYTFCIKNPVPTNKYCDISPKKDFKMELMEFGSCEHWQLCFNAYKMKKAQKAD